MANFNEDVNLRLVKSKLISIAVYLLNFGSFPWYHFAFRFQKTWLNSIRHPYKYAPLCIEMYKACKVSDTVS